MLEFISKHKKWIALAAAAAVLAALLIFKQAGSGSKEEGTAYVETVENLTGQNASLGMINRFAGIIEPQGTWSVAKNSEVEVREIFVSEGDEVEEGQALFEYDTAKYEEDLQQAEIDLERLHNDYTSTQEAITQLEKEKREASSSEQAAYTVQIKEQNLSLKDKELDIRMKEAEIEKLESNIDNSEVKSGISGVVKTINEGSSENEDSNAFITVMKVGTYRVKGTVNEQNIGEIYQDAKVLVHSRVNDRVWKGTITKIDTENAVSSEGGGYFGGSSDAAKSSKYPFYVELESSEGLIMGQHVYVELDLGQEDGENQGGIWIGSYMVDQTDPDHPFVWTDRGGRLRKQEVTIGEVREEVGKVKITEGLTLEDSISIPDGTLKEGMKTAPMSEKPEENVEGEAGEEEGEGVYEGAGEEFGGEEFGGEEFGGQDFGGEPGEPDGEAGQPDGEGVVGAQGEGSGLVNEEVAEEEPAGGAQ